VTAVEVLKDAYGRIREAGSAVVDGLPDDLLTRQPEGRGNSIAWLVWHAARVQDDHVAGAAGVLGRQASQVWLDEGWADRFGLPLSRTDTGYGHSLEQVRAVRASADLLTGYLDAVTARTVRFLDTLTEADFGTVVDTRWDPPVTLAVRLVSVVEDDLQHLGQAAYVRGLLGR
jgi:uncharacterized damage-inducible protein DinB